MSRREHTRESVVFLALACAMAITYLLEYLALPFGYGPLFDSLVYLEQARQVRLGHHVDPTLLAFSPLYGYFLALFGTRAISPLVVQLALGVVDLLLVRRIVRQMFDERAARWATLLVLFYGPLLFYQTKILSETLGLTLLLLGMERFSTLAPRPIDAAERGGTGSSPFYRRLPRLPKSNRRQATGDRQQDMRGADATSRCAPKNARETRRGEARPALPDEGGRERPPSVDALAGLWLALAVLARASLLFALPLFVIWRLTRSRPRGLVLAVAMALPLLGHGLFVYARTGLFVPVILVSSTAATATRSDWTGDLDVFRGEHEAHVGAFSVVDQARARLLRHARGELEPAHDGVSVLGWAKNAPSKALLTFRDEETSFDYGFYGERSEMIALRIAFVSFGMLVAWAIIGGIFAIRERRGTLLVPLVLGMLLCTTMFHPSARYRLPLVFALAPLAGLAWARADRRLRIVLAAIAVVFVIHDLRRGLAHPGLWELRVAESAAVAGDGDTCTERVMRARTLERDAAVTERIRYIGAIMPGCVR